MDSNRRVVPSFFWAVIVLLAETAAYGQISLPAPGDIDTIAGRGTRITLRFVHRVAGKVH